MDQKKFLEIVERSNTGVRVTSDDWNLKYVAKLCRKVSRAHVRLQYGREIRDVLLLKRFSIRMYWLLQRNQLST